ncbi:unnamed protein product [Eruca vesicaria subsp. sativa]|uniref:Uncharacterized protein n=1 Tax=Eruca vesicaria subsp. sativa TaxID=29727 RepID=A0ABC8ITG1_ERUVS|nr:unnamed protein product [Eruca vesicaria subsp. sativa]
MEMKRKEREPENPSLFYLNLYLNISKFPNASQSLNDSSFDNTRTRVSLFDFPNRKQNIQPLFKKIRYSPEHGCIVMNTEESPSPTSTSFLRDLSPRLVRGNGNANIPEIYTKDLVSTIGSRDHYSADLVPNFGENSSSINDSKDWGLDLSL